MNAASALESLLVLLILFVLGLQVKAMVDIATLRGDVRNAGRNAARGYDVRGLRTALEDVAAQVKDTIGPIVAILGALHRAGVVTTEEMLGILSTYNAAWEGVGRWEREHGNPLTREELARFEAYRVTPPATDQGTDRRFPEHVGEDGRRHAKATRLGDAVRPGGDPGRHVVCGR